MRDEYFCPNCNAILNNQRGFNPNKGSWTCTKCGTHLMDDDVYEGDSFEGVAWYCDRCGALLNRQSGFRDYYGSWKCKECGNWNSISEDDIINNEYEDEDEDEDEPTYFESYHSSPAYNRNQKNLNYESNNSSSRDDDRTVLLVMLLMFGIAVFCMFMSFLCTVLGI